CPVIQTLANSSSVQSVRRSLQCLHIGGPQKGIVVLPKADAPALEFAFHEMMTVDVIRGLKGKKRAHTHHHRAEYFIPYIEVQMGEPRRPLANRPIVRIGGGVLRIE